MHGNLDQSSAANAGSQSHLRFHAILMHQHSDPDDFDRQYAHPTGHDVWEWLPADDLWQATTSTRTHHRSSTANVSGRWWHSQSNGNKRSNFVLVLLI